MSTGSVPAHEGHLTPHASNPKARQGRKNVERERERMGKENKKPVFPASLSLISSPIKKGCSAALQREAKPWGHGGKRIPSARAHTAFSVQQTKSDPPIFLYNILPTYACTVNLSLHVSLLFLNMCVWVYSSSIYLFCTSKEYILWY